MRAGDFKTPVALQRKSVERDSLGQRLDVWTTYAPLVWADVKAGSGLATIKAGGLPAASTAYSVRVRFRTDVREGDRVLCNGYVLDVENIRHDHKGREWIDLVCEEIDYG